jgi:hypothetical protein
MLCYNFKQKTLNIIPQAKKNKRDKAIFILSGVVFIYFGTLILAYKLKYETTIISVLGEILTIPFVVLLFVLLFLSLRSLIKEKDIFMSYPFYAVLILLLTLTLMVYFA